MDLVIRFLVGANQAAIPGKLFVCCAGNHFAATITAIAACKGINTQAVGQRNN